MALPYWWTFFTRHVVLNDYCLKIPMKNQFRKANFVTDHFMSRDVNMHLKKPYLWIDPVFRKYRDNKTNKNTIEEYLNFNEYPITWIDCNLQSRSWHAGAEIANLILSGKLHFPCFSFHPFFPIPFSSFMSSWGLLWNFAKGVLIARILLFSLFTYCLLFIFNNWAILNCN